MKRIVIYIMMLAMAVMVFVSCGEKKDAEKDVSGCEIAVISETPNIKEGSVGKAAWESAEGFAKENGINSGLYKPEEASSEGYLAAIKNAVDNGAEIIILPGSSFETVAYQMQSSYPDIMFLLVDGVSHDGNGTYGTGANTVDVIFSEEEAGYLAGYAAVEDGNTKLGFIGSESIPAIKRYGYGFVQGAAAAAEKSEKKVEMNYAYAGSSEKSDEVQTLASGWYENGTEVIFVCSGDITESVIESAEKNQGKVIGADADKSGLSESVITTAEKCVGVAVENILKNYTDKKFVGGTAFNYAAKNDGVAIEMENSRFNSFNDKDYKEVFKKLKNGKIELKKDTSVKAVSELTGEWITIKE